MSTPYPIPSPRAHHPLEATWIEQSLSITVEERTVTGIVRANWGAIEVAITSPITGLSRSRDGRGWAFALACHHHPKYRYALGGELTERGWQTADRFLADLFLDWLAVSRREAAVDERCRRTRRELADLDPVFTARTGPLYQERISLRRKFRAGELLQRDYQQRLKELRQRLEQVDQERCQAEAAIAQRFTDWLQERCGRNISLDTAEKLLAEVAIIVEVGAER
jgi:hypothetical protein